MTHTLHIFRGQQAGEGESRVQMCAMPGEDYVAVRFDDARRGWVATVYRCTLGGTVLAAKAWGEAHRRKRDAVEEARTSGIPFMPGFKG